MRMRSVPCRYIFNSGTRGGWGNECGGGHGGTQTGGGAKGCHEGYVGERFFGGRGAQNDAGAGGGGWFGGAGGGYNSGGGGGSSYIGNDPMSGLPVPANRRPTVRVSCHFPLSFAALARERGRAVL